MKKIVPFNYMVRKSGHYCPKCSVEMSSTVDRTLCKKLFGGFMSKCPKIEHFHHRCLYCNGEWIESTFENSLEGAEIAINAAFESADNAGLSEEDMLKKWRDTQVRKVMES